MVFTICRQQFRPSSGREFFCFMYSMCFYKVTTWIRLAVELNWRVQKGLADMWHIGVDGWRAGRSWAALPLHLSIDLTVSVVQLLTQQFWKCSVREEVEDPLSPLSSKPGDFSDDSSATVLVRAVPVHVQIPGKMIDISVDVLYNIFFKSRIF